MSKALTLTLVVASLVGCTTSREISETERKILEAQSALNLREQQIREKSPASLAPTKQLEAEIRYRPIQIWLHETTSTGLTINIVGVNSSGDFVYSPGIGKAWLEPPHDSKGFSKIQGVVLAGRPDALDWSARFDAAVEARARFSILGVGGNVKCFGALPTTSVFGSFALGTPSGVVIPYRMILGSGNRTNVRAGCGLGALGTTYLNFPLGTIAGETVGTFDLGLRQSGEVSIPGEQVSKLKYTLGLLSPQIHLSEYSLILRSDLELKIEKQGEPK